MTIIKAIILGLIQGLTEFLPISSSGHLLIAENLMDLSNDMIFSLMLHLATLLAVIMFYWRDIIELIKNPKSSMAKSLYASFIPTVILALIVRKVISDYLFINSIGFLFILTGIILLLPRMIRKKSCLGLGPKSGAIIGFMQGIACIPGISRSGMTIVTGQFCGLTKEESVRFSFILSIPIIIGGVLYELLFSSKVVISTIMGIPMLLGFITAFITGLISIKLVSKLASDNKFYMFSIYLFIIGCLCSVNTFIPII